MNDFTGNDLRALGYEPEPWFGPALKEIQDRKLSRSQAIRVAKQAKAIWDEKQPKTIGLQDGAPFVVNITAENEDERANMDAVIKGFRDLVRVPTVIGGAIMPDACPTDAGSIPVGGVIGAKNAIHPGMHSADVCCSMFLTIVDADPKDVLDAMAAVTHFGAGGRQDRRFTLDEGLLEQFRKNAFLDNGKAIGAALSNLGTQGDGNHFTYVGVNGNGQTVLVTHHGSRGVGGFLYKAGMKVAKAHTEKVSPDTPLKNAWIPLDSKVGEDYWDALMIVREWTKENHRVLHDAALESLGLAPVDRFWNPHNFCIPGDQIVQTPTGPVRMDSILPGDEVFSFDPQKGLVTTKVLKSWHSGNKRIFTIRMRNRKIRVSGQHPIQVVKMKNGSPSYEWVNAENLRKGDLVVCAQPKTAELENSWGLKKARFIGAYLGDGWIRNEKDIHKGHTVGLAIGSFDEEHTQKYLNLVNELFANVKWKNNGKGAFGLSCNSKKVWQNIVDMGISGSSKERRLPEDAFIQPLRVKQEILAGYFDADGSIFTPGFSNEGQGRVICANYGLAQDLRELAISCGMKVSNLRQNSIITNFGPCTTTQFYISAQDTFSLPLWHEQKIQKLRDKQSRAQGRMIKGLAEHKNVFVQSVIEVTEDDSEDVYDITVQHPTHSFVCEGVVVHNCFREDDVIWHAKGATPIHNAFNHDSAGKQIIPMNMAQPILIVEGQRNAQNLGFAPHGAGRNLSRSAHVRSKGDTPIEEIFKMETAGLDARFHSDKIDISELPSAYKDADSVQRDMERFGLATVIDKIQPYGCIMAGEQPLQPWQIKKMNQREADARREDSDPSM